MLANLQGTPIQRLRRFVFSLHVVEFRELLEMVRQVGVRTSIFFVDFQRLLKKLFSLAVPLTRNIEFR